MKLSNKFKIAWWILLLILFGIPIVFRISAITSGTANIVDVFLLLIYVSLLLFPLFKELEFFGIVKLKSEIEDLKNKIDIKFGDLKNEIKATQNQTINQTFQTPSPPPPDSKIPELKEELKQLIQDNMKAIQGHQTSTLDYDVPKNNLTLFQVRYSIERELRRIWEGRYLQYEDNQYHRQMPVFKIISTLSNDQIFNSGFGNVLREINSICNYGIHGEKVSKNQVDFVVENATEVINYLKSIE